MGVARRTNGGVGKAHVVAFFGVVCLVVLAVFQALRDTHPDAVATRHDGATDFLSRKAHESGPLHTAGLFGTGGRSGGLGQHGRYHGSGHVVRRDEGSVVNPFHPSGYSDKATLARTIAGGDVVTQSRGRQDTEELNGHDIHTTVKDETQDATENYIIRDEITSDAEPRGNDGAVMGGNSFPEFPDSLKPNGVGSSGDSGGRTTQCVSKQYRPHTEFWGAVVTAGNENMQVSADKCCQSCASKRTCTAWVWHPQSHECWLKSDDDPNPQPHSSGDGVPWTSGVLPKVTGATVRYQEIDDENDSKRVQEIPTCLHTVLTSSGNAYMNWQSRIMYQTYKKYASEPNSILKAFTRVLHRGTDDELIFEIPTMRFDPNQQKCDHWCDYPVADRSLAIAQWSKTTNSKICSHVMMVETDYIYVKSPPRSILKPKGQAMGFEYQYIGPREPNIARVMREYLADIDFDTVTADHPARGHSAMLPRTGNAPSCLHVSDLRKVAPLWAEFVERTETPEDTRKALGWLRDMYAYDAAILIAGIEHEVYGAPKSLLMAQPPADDTGEKDSNGNFHFNAFLLHYTWGPEIYDKDENKLWVLDKRAYGGGQYQKGPYALVKLEQPPVWEEGNPNGLQLQTFFNPRVLTESKLYLLRVMIDEFNSAVEKLPRVPKGFGTLKEAEKAAE